MRRRGRLQRPGAGFRARRPAAASGRRSSLAPRRRGFLFVHFKTSAVTLPSLMRVGRRWHGLPGNPVRHRQTLLGSPKSVRRFHQIPALKSVANSDSKNGRSACRLNRQPTQRRPSLARYDEPCTPPIVMRARSVQGFLERLTLKPRRLGVDSASRASAPTQPL